jgi:hypothetical protein
MREETAVTSMVLQKNANTLNVMREETAVTSMVLQKNANTLNVMRGKIIIQPIDCTTYRVETSTTYIAFVLMLLLSTDKHFV